MKCKNVQEIKLALQPITKREIASPMLKIAVNEYSFGGTIYEYTN